MRKKPHNKILGGEFKEQHINTVLKFCPFKKKKVIEKNYF